MYRVASGSGEDYLHPDSELCWPWRLGASYAPGLSVSAGLSQAQLHWFMAFKQRNSSMFGWEEGGCLQLRSGFPQCAASEATLGRDSWLMETRQKRQAWSGAVAGGPNTVTILGL